MEQDRPDKGRQQVEEPVPAVEDRHEARAGGLVRVAAREWVVAGATAVPEERRLAQAADVEWVVAGAERNQQHTAARSGRRKTCQVEIEQVRWVWAR